MIASPISTPAFSSYRVRPRSTRSENSVNASVAVAKRRPTKKNGPLTCIAWCTAKKVPPQIMVMKINTASGSLICGTTAEIKDFFAADTGLPFLLSAI